MNFEQLYSETANDLKIKFLDSIVGNNISLQNEYTSFVLSEKSSPETYPTQRFIELLTLNRKKYLRNFENVDLENPDWESYNKPHSGYIAEWEAYQFASEQEFQSIFKTFVQEAVNIIISQNPVELVAMLIGLYEASLDAEIKDEVCSFDDVNEHLLSEFEVTIGSVTEKLKMSALSERLIIDAFEKFLAYCDSEYPGNLHFAGYFEDLLIALAEKSTKPIQLLSAIDNSSVERKLVPKLILFLNKKAGNKDEWVKSAILFHRSNNEVAKQLLQHYFNSDKISFVQTAIELFNTDKKVWSGFLKDYLTIDLDNHLYINVFYQLTIIERNIEHYSKIRSYLSKKELDSLLGEFDWDKAFQVQILALEKHYDRIRQMVETNANDWHFEDLISPILEIFPAFCFQSIKNKARLTIANRRGRDVYERVANWLKLTHKIPGFETEKRALITDLYNFKPNLPALKDELKKANLL